MPKTRRMLLGKRKPCRNRKGHGDLRKQCIRMPGRQTGSSTFAVELPPEYITYRRAYEVDHQAERGRVAETSGTRAGELEQPVHALQAGVAEERFPAAHNAVQVFFHRPHRLHDGAQQAIVTCYLSSIFAEYIKMPAGLDHGVRLPHTAQQFPRVTRPGRPWPYTDHAFQAPARQLPEWLFWALYCF